jgi:hypothetical protein
MRILFSKIDAAVKGPSLLFILSVLSSSAWSQEVTLEELAGAVINVSAVHQEKIIRDGQIHRAATLRSARERRLMPPNHLEARAANVPLRALPVRRALWQYARAKGFRQAGRSCGYSQLSRVP